MEKNFQSLVVQSEYDSLLEVHYAMTFCSMARPVPGLMTTAGWHRPENWLMVAIMDVVVDVLDSGWS